MQVYSSLHIAIHMVKSVTMSNAKEDPRKRLREKLREIEDELKEYTSVCPAAQEFNHMCRVAATPVDVTAQISLC